MNSQSSKLIPAIIVDMDGTFSLLNGRNPYDASKCDENDLPNWPVIHAVEALYDAGYKVVFCSGREDRFKEPTERFIQKYFCKWSEDIMGYIPRDFILFMRKTKDNRKDSIIKEEIYNEHIKGIFNVLCVFDDRQQVVDKWRELGLTCFQVAPGQF